MTQPRVRGRPFKPGHAGRPPGSKNKVTRMAEQLVEGQAEHLIGRALALAHDGDVSCLRMLLDRVWPLRKGQPISFEMPRIGDSTDLVAAVASVWNAIADGRITPDEANALSLLAERSMQIVQMHDVAKRLDELEKKGGINA
jgi:hypothetical protein